MSLQSLKTILGGDTEATLAVVDQKTGLRRSVGWICHSRYPSRSPENAFLVKCVSCFKEMFNAKLSMLN